MTSRREVKVAIVGDETDYVKSLKRASSETDGALKGLGEKFSGFAKKAALGAGVAIGGALSKGIFDAMDIEAANDKLAAQLGLSLDDAKKFGQLSGKLYSEAYGDSIEDVNRALGAVQSTLHRSLGEGGRDLERVTKHALDFAAAFEIDVSKAVNTVGILVKEGLAKDAVEGFDLIVGAAQSVSAEVREDILDAVDEYSQFFRTLGFKGQRTFGLLLRAAKGGRIEIDKVGDAIKEFTIRSTDMSTASVDAYKKIGLNAKLMARDILAGGETASAAFDKITQGLLGIKDPVDQANAAIALFGTPIEDLNTGDIPEFLQNLANGADAFDNLSGSAQAMGDTLNDNTKTKLEAFKRQALMALAEFAATTLIPLIEEKLVPAFKKISDWASNNQETVKVMAALIGVALAGAMVKAGLAAVFGSASLGLFIIASAALIAGLSWATTKLLNSDGFISALQKIVDVLAAIIDMADKAVTALKHIPGLTGLVSVVESGVSNVANVAGKIGGALPGGPKAATVHPLTGRPVTSRAQAGVVPGAFGQPMPILAHGGEMVLTRGQQNRAGGGMNITINMPPGSDGRDVVEQIRRYERSNGTAWRN